jgi:hypothetical protein
MAQREMVELLALGMFFGATSDPAYHKNQARLGCLSEETANCQGRSEAVEKQIAARKKGISRNDEDEDLGPGQMQLLQRHQ